MTINTDHQRAALDLLRENGGSMRVQEVVNKCVMPSVQVRPVMALLIAARKVTLQGNDLYVLATQAEAKAVAVAIAPKPKPVKVPAEVQKPQPQEPAPVTTKSKKQRRCVRCEELLALDQFPMRPGMVRAPRICIGCLPPDDKIGSPSDRARMNLPPTRDQVPFKIPGPDADPPPPNMEPIKPLKILGPLQRVLDSPYVLIEVEVHTTVRKYMEQLVATGLWGNTVEDCAQQILLEGVRKAILGETPRS